MMYYKAAHAELLETLLKIQETSAPITLSIGYTTSDNQVHKGVVLHEAPPTVARELVRLGYSLDLTPAGMLVYKI